MPMITVRIVIAQLTIDSPMFQSRFLHYFLLLFLMIGALHVQGSFYILLTNFDICYRYRL